MPDSVNVHHSMPEATAPGAVDPFLDMDIIGVVEGSDKSSSNGLSWDYLRHYDALFGEFRHAPINLLEVGVQGGPSIRLWKWYFSQARIVGIDINPACASMAEDRVVIEIGSQADSGFLDQVCADYPPTLFIDDGSHLAQHNIFTFEHVFPLLLPGGVYVVEDLAFHFGPRSHEWQGPEKRDAPSYFLDLARSKMARRHTEGAEQAPAHLLDMVDSVTFVGSAAIIRKARAARQLDNATALARAHIAAQGLGGGAHARLAGYLLKHGGALDEAETSCRAALAAGPSLDASKSLADILQRTGRDDEARQVLVLAGQAPSTELRAMQGLARMQFQAGLNEAAAATLTAILARDPERPASLKLMERVQARLSGRRAKS